MAQRIVQTDENVDPRTVFAALKRFWQSGSTSAFQDAISTLSLNVTASEMATWYRMATRHLLLYTDVSSALSELRNAGYRLNVVTNGPAAVQHLKIDSLQIAPMVDRIVVADDYGRPYWKPAGVLWSILHVRPGCCLVVGNGDDDAEFAAIEGVPFIGIERSGSIHRLNDKYRKETLILTSLNGIASMLQGVAK